MEKISDPEALWENLRELKSQARSLGGSIEAIRRLESDWAEAIQTPKKLSNELGSLTSENEKQASHLREAVVSSETRLNELIRDSTETIKRDRDESSRRLEAFENYVKGRVSDFQELLDGFRSRTSELESEHAELKDEVHEKLHQMEAGVGALEAKIEADLNELEARISSKFTQMSVLLWMALILSLIALVAAFL